MRSLLIVGAAIVLASGSIAGSAYAGGPGLFIGGCEYGDDGEYQVHCSVNGYKTATNSTLSNTQKQNADIDPPPKSGKLVQFQFGLNYKFKGNGGVQSNDQTQNATLVDSKVYTHRPVQNQTGINVVLDGGSSQYTTQSQTLNANNISINGTLQSQSAVNIAGSGNGNVMIVNQSQTLTLHGDPKPSCGDYGRCYPGPS